MELISFFIYVFEPSRDKDHTYVAVFTDGQSNSYSDTVAAANRLKNKATIISIGIGSGAKADELNAISTDGTHYLLDDFDEIEALVGEILQETCSDFQCDDLFQIAGDYILDDTKFPTLGTSHKTAVNANYRCPETCTIHQPDPKKTGDILQKNFDQQCIDECTVPVARLHLDSLRAIKQNIITASKGKMSPSIVAGVISVLGFGADPNAFDDEGFVFCLHNGKPKKCWGAMAIPHDEATDALKTKGPLSVEAIAAGIENLRKMAGCVCEKTPQTYKYGIEAQLNLGMNIKDNIRIP